MESEKFYLIKDILTSARMLMSFHADPEWCEEHGHEGMVDLKNTVKKLADASLLLRRIPMRHVKMLNSVLDDEE